MEAGTKVTVTLKDGKKAKGEFVSAGKGWNVVSIKGVEQKFRTKDMTGPKEPKAVKEKSEGDEPLIKADLEHYVIHESTTATGRRHLDIDDDVATKLREMDLSGIYKYAASVLEVTQKELLEKYQNLNPGMQRMNLGNRVRAVFRLAANIKDGTVTTRQAPRKAA